MAFTATARLGPLGAPISSVPVRLPVGLAPSAVNSPEKMVTPSAAGVVAEPAYLPEIAELLKGPGLATAPKTEHRPRGHQHITEAQSRRDRGHQIAEIDGPPTRLRARNRTYVPRRAEETIANGGGDHGSLDET